MPAALGEQPGPEAVDEHGADPRVLPQAQHVAEPVDADGAGDRRQQLGQRAGLVVRQRGTPGPGGAGRAVPRGHARGREVAADSARAKRRASSTASCPSASALTRSDRSSPVTLPV